MTKSAKLGRVIINNKLNNGGISQIFGYIKRFYTDSKSKTTWMGSAIPPRDNARRKIRMTRPDGPVILTFYAFIVFYPRYWLNRAQKPTPAP